MKRRDGSGEVSNEQNASRYFKSVTTGRRLLDRLTSMGVKYQVAANRLRGSLIGPDGRQTCVLATLTDEAVLNLRDVIGSGSHGWLRFWHDEGILQKALRKCNIDPAAVHLGGPPVDSVAIDEEGESTLYRLFIGLQVSLPWPGCHWRGGPCAASG